MGCTWVLFVFIFLYFGLDILHSQISMMFQERRKMVLQFSEIWVNDTIFAMKHHVYWLLKSWYYEFFEDEKHLVWNQKGDKKCYLINLNFLWYYRTWERWFLVQCLLSIFGLLLNIGLDQGSWSCKIAPIKKSGWI